MEYQEAHYNGDNDVEGVQPPQPGICQPSIFVLVMNGFADFLFNVSTPQGI